ncbi:MAG: hypothetical protein CM15mP102_20080 [Flavobacteriales bacterium]|nr:MAG: hypothetical protein CM15mP102_20080 [Flavobacteriales bacterium]
MGLIRSRVGMPISKIPLRNLDNVSMDKYNVLVLGSGNYKLSNNQIEKIKKWVRVVSIISIGSGSKFLIDNKIVDESIVEKKESNVISYLEYGDAAENRGKEQVGGVILKSKIDLTHHYLFGYSDNSLPVYKNNSIWLKTLN